MADNEVFNKLVSGMSPDDRQKLQEKFNSQSIVSSEALYSDSDDHDHTVSAAQTGVEYDQLPWFYRLWFSFLSLFEAKDPTKVYEDWVVSILGKRIDDRYPGYFDYQNGQLLPGFYRQMMKMRDASRFFYTTLDMTFNRDKGALIAFIGSTEMPETHRMLQTETDPEFIAKNNPNANDAELHQIAYKTMEDALSLVTDAQRGIMYTYTRSLYCLKGLSSFLYDRVIMAFGFNSMFNGETCSVGFVRDLLITFSNTLHSMKTVPPMPLLESLFIFYLHEEAEEPDFDITTEIRSLMRKAEESLTVIREFNKKVPLTWIIRCSSRDMSHKPKDISGGEDWFVVYRDYWRRHIDSMLSIHLEGRRRRELYNSFQTFFGTDNLKTMVNVQSDLKPDAFPIKEDHSLSFLLSFYSLVFMPEINLIIRPILIDGDFQKKENRIEFVEAYNNIIKMEDEVNKLDSKISPEGDYFKRYNQARQDMSSLPIKRRKIQIVVDEAEEEAIMIVTRVRDACETIINVLYGILGKDIRNKYGSLANLQKIAGKNEHFSETLEKIIQQFSKTLNLLNEIEAMQNEK